MHRQLNGKVEELDKDHKDHEQKDEIGGRLDPQNLCRPDRDLGENADDEQKRGENDPIDRVVYVKLGAADLFQHEHQHQKGRDDQQNA